MSEECDASHIGMCGVSHFLRKDITNCVFYVLRNFSYGYKDRITDYSIRPKI